MLRLARGWLVPPLVALLSLGLFAAGCGKLAPADGASALWEIESSSIVAGSSVTVVEGLRSGHYSVGTTAFEFRVDFTTPPSGGRPWVTVTTTARHDEERTSEGVTARFYGGPVGEKIGITVSPVAIPGETTDTLAVEIERIEDATASLEVRRAGNWTPPVPGEFLGKGPLAFRLSFSRDMD